MSTRLFVGNLPWDTTSEDLADVFRPIGGLLSSHVIREKVNGRSKGFGFVTFAEEELAVAAIDYATGISVGGRVLRVYKAWPGGVPPLSRAPRYLRDIGLIPAGADEISSDDSDAYYAANDQSPHPNLIAELHTQPFILHISNQVSEELMRRLTRYPLELRSPAISSRLFEEIIAEIGTASALMSN